MMTFRDVSSRVAFFSVALALAAGCGGSDTPSARPPPTTSEAPTTAGGAAAPSNESTMTQGSGDTGAGQGATLSPTSITTTTSGGANSAMGMSAAPSSASLTDEQIVRVTQVANAGEIEQATIAQQKAKDPRVKRFAVMMVKDHTEADAKGSELATRNRLTPSDSSTSAVLKTDSDSAVQQLRLQTGSDFDHVYIDAQVKAHQSVLDTLDNKLLPNAKSPELKTLLQTVRMRVASHLKEAQDIQKSLATR